MMVILIIFLSMTSNLVANHSIVHIITYPVVSIIVKGNKDEHIKELVIL